MGAKIIIEAEKDKYVVATIVGDKPLFWRGGPSRDPVIDSFDKARTYKGNEIESAGYRALVRARSEYPHYEWVMFSVTQLQKRGEITDKLVRMTIRTMIAVNRSIKDIKGA